MNSHIQRAARMSHQLASNEADELTCAGWWIAANSARDFVGCVVTPYRAASQRAMTVIFFEYTGGLWGMCMSSPISSCNVCLPGGS
jgi:hypothetical protein